MNGNNDVILSDRPLTWQQVVQVARQGRPLSLADSAWMRIEDARSAVEQTVANGKLAYGINTGLGALSNVRLDDSQLAQLSRNTLLSHACGVGAPLPIEQTRAIICAAINNFAHGHSGIHPLPVRGLLAMLNQQITPLIPSQGSVGYLTHMAHIGIALLGMGEVHWQGQTVPAQTALNAIGMMPVKLAAKDGLSLVNGTPCMTGLACLGLADALNLATWADITSAMSFEALRGQIEAFDEDVLALKPYPGAQQVGINLRSLLANSEVIAKSQGMRTQDALSLRSIPQIHGACRDQIRHAEEQINTELASATDNPLIVGARGSWRIVSNANPHGESVAMAADLLCIALTELAGVAERRIDRLVNPLVSGLPAFLISQPGVNSGMMIAQYVAASLVGENRQLAQPAVVENFVTSALQEDHLSLGTTAALKLLKVIENTTWILAIEYLLAAQAFEFLKQQRFGAGTGKAWQLLRTQVPPYERDRWLAPDISSAARFIRQPASWVIDGIR